MSESLLNQANQADLGAALVGRGVNPELAAGLLIGIDGQAIERTLTWYDEQAGRVGPGVLVAELRSGGRPAAPKRQPTHGQSDYLERISDWIAEHLPDLCGCSPKVVECERRAYGDTLADKMERYTEPHYAAIAAVIQLHSRHGRGSLTVREHGPVIRAAVKESDRQAIEDYGAILEKREATAGIEGEGAR